MHVWSLQGKFTLKFVTLYVYFWLAQDFNCTILLIDIGRARPISVTASAAGGVAVDTPYNCAPGTMDTITLMVKWENLESGNPGTAVYTCMILQTFLQPKILTNRYPAFP